MKGKVILRTERLCLREAVVSDARFFYRLMRQEEWIRFIGDRGIRRVADAEQYILDRVVAGYQQHGFGMWVVTLHGRQGGIGICGLVNRDTLDAPDIGFAFLNAYVGQGYAVEAASAVLKYSMESLELPKVLAITNPDNARSIRVLERIGMEQNLQNSQNSQNCLRGSEDSQNCLRGSEDLQNWLRGSEDLQNWLRGSEDSQNGLLRPEDSVNSQDTSGAGDSQDALDSDLLEGGLLVFQWMAGD